MKYGIIIPTYIDHFKHVVRFLESVRENCTDYSDFNICFITSKHEMVHLIELISEYCTTQPKLKVSVTTLEFLIKRMYGETVDENWLLETVGKYNFQSAKKILGVRYFDHDYSLVLDSECLMIRPCSIKDIFENYLKTKRVFYTDNSDVFPESMERVTKSSLSFIREVDRFKPYYMFEHDSWIFEKQIVSDMFTHIEAQGKTFYQLLFESKLLFEVVMYYWYIYFNNKYGYQFVDATALIKSYLGEHYEKHHNYMNKIGFTDMEYICFGLSPNNLDCFSKMYEDYSLNFFRLNQMPQFLCTDTMQCQLEFLNKTPSVKLLTGVWLNSRIISLINKG